MSQTMTSLWMVGAGKMGQALYGGWIKADLPIAQITLIDPQPKPADVTLRAADQWAAQPHTQIKPDILIIAIKPQMIADTLPAYTDLIRPDTLVLSIAAGTSIKTIASLLGHPDQPIIRTMPNTPAMVGQGITAAFANSSVTDAQRMIAQQLLEAVGDVVWLSAEDQMHAVTALSGSGPAYVFALIEAMAKAGVAQGLSVETAMQLARQTVIGSGALAAALRDVPANTLRENVTSPGGTTAAGLSVLQGAHGLDELLAQTVAAAAQRSEELGQG